MCRAPLSNRVIPLIKLIPCRVTGMNAEDRFVVASKLAGALFAFPALALLRYRHQTSQGIELLGKSLAEESMRDGLLQCFEDGRLNCSNRGATSIAFERAQFAVSFRQDYAVALYARIFVGDDGSVQNFGGHDLYYCRHRAAGTCSQPLPR